MNTFRNCEMARNLGLRLFTLNCITTGKNITTEKDVSFFIETGGAKRSD
jgi:hypothetical protein